MCGHAERRDAARHLADGRHPLRGEVEPGRQHDAEHQHDEAPRHARREPRAEEQHRQRARADRGRERRDVAEVRQDRPGPLEHVARLGRHAQQARDLADDDEQHEAEHEPRHDRLGQELRGPADAQQTTDDEREAGGDRERRGETDGPLRIALREARDERAGEHRHRRDRPDHEVRRGAEHGVRQQRQRDRVEPDLNRHAGDAGVAERLGNRERGDDGAGQQVAGQVGPRVARQPRGHGHTAEPGARPAVHPWLTCRSSRRAR